MMASNNIHLRESESNLQPRVKVPPQPSSVPIPFSYTPSDDGTDENLLILLHGLGEPWHQLIECHPDRRLLGDTHVPFSKLGRSLKLPQTATLALRAPEQ